MQRTDELSAIPVELILESTKYLPLFDVQNLSMVSKKMHTLFKPKLLLDKFLQRVAFGMQDKIEQLFTDVFGGDAAKIQEALGYRGVFTDYSGRTFRCSAYEYAYWAKDTHMCRMLEHFMDEQTKAEILVKIEKNDRKGLAYQQNGEPHCSAHFDFTALKEAYQRCIELFDALARDPMIVEAVLSAWLDVGKAQRNVPAHVAQEYCHPDRAFDPLPSFNVDRDDIPKDTLARKLTFFNATTTLCVESWFPLPVSNSGLGFNFALLRGRIFARAPFLLIESEYRPRRADWAAINHLDEVRTDELRFSREHLSPSVISKT